MKLFVFIQHDKDKINPVSLEALHGAQTIASQSDSTVTAIIFNSAAAETLTRYDIAEILVVDDKKLETYSPLSYLNAMEKLISEESPDALVFGHTYEARDWVPRLSARLDIPFISDCINVF